MGKDKKALILMLVTLGILTAPLSVFAANFKKAENWAEKPEKINKVIDVFFIPGTSSSEKDSSKNISIKDVTMRKEVKEELLKEHKIYDHAANLFAPYYGSASKNALKEKDQKKKEKILKRAYKDVKDAFFKQYLKEDNTDRPFILAGIDQGSEMAVRLYKDMSEDQRKRMVITYAVDWSAPEQKHISAAERFKNRHKKKDKEEETLPLVKTDKDINAIYPLEKDSRKVDNTIYNDLYDRTSNYLYSQPDWEEKYKPIFTKKASATLNDIKSELKLNDYHFKLRKPRDTRIYTEAIAIHHSGTPTDQDLSAKAIQSMHLNNGWYGIGYHFVIRKNGSIEIGTPLETIGAHAYMHNFNTIGIHLSGNFEIGRPTFRQLNSLEHLLAHLTKDYEIPITNITIAGHNHFNHDTACPGTYLSRQLPTIRKKAQEYKDQLMKK